MSDPAVDFVLLPQRGAEPFKLKKPSHRFRAKFLTELRASRRQKMKANMAEAGIVGDQQFSELEGFDNEPPYRNDKFIEYINTSEGEVDVLARLIKQTVTDDSEVERIIDAYDEPIMPIMITLFKLTWAETEVNPPKPPAAQTAEANPTGNPTSYVPMEIL